MKNFNGMRYNLIRVFLVFAGAFIAAAAFDFFLIPMQVAPGGISGLASAVCDITGNIFPVGGLMLLFNLPLFWAGLKRFGRNFFFESLCGTAAFSIMTDFFAVFSDDALNFIYGESGNTDRIVSAVWGGVLMGVGLGLVFRAGATTGGTDIMARLIWSRNQTFSIGELILFLDAVIIVIIAFMYRSFDAAMYSGITVFISSKMIDAVEAGVNYARKVIIVTSKPDELSKAIMCGVARGVTKLDAVGMYEKNSLSVLMCVIYKGQMTKIQKIILGTDPEAFVAVSDVRSVSGEFKR